jgi:hypothetical protein
MSKIMRLATSPHIQEHHALRELIKIKSGLTSGATDNNLFILENLELLKDNKILDTTYNVIDSAIEIDPDPDFITGDLSIIRSPIKGKYIRKPITLHQARYNKCSRLHLEWNEINNKLTIVDINFSPAVMVPEIVEKPLRNNDEKEEDTLPYFDMKSCCTARHAEND